MKKSIFFFAMGLAVLTSCDPEKETKDFDVINITAEQLLNGATFKQFAQQTDENGNVLGYVEAADGNYIEYNIPGVNAISIFTKDEEGTETLLQNTVTGTFIHSGGGMFSLVPRRGSDSNQTVFFRYINQNGQSVESSTSFNVYVPSDIAYELKLLASNDYGKKIWKWDPTITGAVWGNMGYLPGDGVSVGTSGNGQWWGVTSTDEFGGQLQHSEGSVAHGDGDLDAYMEITEGGKIISYAADGTVIREGAFSVDGFTGEYDASGWRLGLLKTDAILWPWIINTNATLPSAATWGPNAYEIVYLTPDKLTLVYPGHGDDGNVNGAKPPSGTSPATPISTAWQLAMARARTGPGTRASLVPYGAIWATCLATATLSAPLAMVNGGVSPLPMSLAGSCSTLRAAWPTATAT